MGRDYTAKNLHSWETISKSQKRCKKCNCILTLKTVNHVNFNSYQKASGEVVEKLECVNDKPDLSEFYK